MSRSDLVAEIEKTRLSTSQITCWCMTIALHQAFGVGKIRLERVHTRMLELENENAQLMVGRGKAAAVAARKAWFSGICNEEFRVPLLRAPRNRREKQLAMAGNNGASIAWQIYGRACMEVLGFGPERMKRLRQEAWNNYQQFNTWAHEDLDWAMDNIRRCAEDALKSELEVIEDNDSGVKQAERDFEQMMKNKALLDAHRNTAIGTINAGLDGDLRHKIEAAMQATLNTGPLGRRG